jgi:cellulose synthase/poly-beta-1,6-N-acetylglucosamine synthase-like glycosyltransferase
MRLANTDREPGAHDDREQCQQRPEHAADDTAAGRVSVVIPVWNGRRWIDGCLGSIDRQTLPAHEVIAVDNGSEDDSVAYVW